MWDSGSSEVRLLAAPQPADRSQACDGGAVVLSGPHLSGLAQRHYEHCLVMRRLVRKAISDLQ
jgi:hypothetical protein